MELSNCGMHFVRCCQWFDRIFLVIYGILMYCRVPKFRKRKNLWSRCTSILLTLHKWVRSLSRWNATEATRRILVGWTPNLVCTFFVNRSWVTHTVELLEQFTTVCTLVADLSQVPKVPKTNITGGTYYHTKFDLILLFGLTELQAQLRWKEEVSLFLPSSPRFATNREPCRE
jgi:hypothetical protein